MLLLLVRFLRAGDLRFFAILLSFFLLALVQPGEPFFPTGLRARPGAKSFRRRWV
jgi:hypothetical protein